jgi:hypothetical protein
MNTQRLIEVATNQAALIEEPQSQYRAGLIRCLIDVVTAQEEGLSDKGRRERVAKIVEAFGSKVAAGTSAN